MATNRISRYFAASSEIRSQNSTTLASPPSGFVLLPAGLVGNPAMFPAIQDLHENALRAAVAESEARFLKIMESLQN
jgi:hypothetical protein